MSEAVDRAALEHALTQDVSVLGTVLASRFVRTHDSYRTNGRAEPQERRPKKAVQLDPNTLAPVNPVSCVRTMSKAEALFIDALEDSDEVIWWSYEPVRLELGHSSAVPDFVVALSSGERRVIEIKGDNQELVNEQSILLARKWCEQNDLLYAIHLVDQWWEFESVRRRGAAGRWLVATTGTPMKTHQLVHTRDGARQRVPRGHERAARDLNRAQACQLWGESTLEWSPFSRGSLLEPLNALDIIPVAWVARARVWERQNDGAAYAPILRGWNAENLRHMNHRVPAVGPALHPLVAATITRCLAVGVAAICVGRAALEARDGGNERMPPGQNLEIHDEVSRAFCLLIDGHDRPLGAAVARLSMSDGGEDLPGYGIVAITGDEVVDAVWLSSSAVEDNDPVPGAARPTTLAMKFLREFQANRWELKPVRTGSQLGALYMAQAGRQLDGLFEVDERGR